MDFKVLPYKEKIPTNYGITTFVEAEKDLVRVKRACCSFFIQEDAPNVQLKEYGFLMHPGT